MRCRSTVATDGRPSLAVVELIADLEGTTPEKLSPLLNDVVDPDALDMLFCSSDRSDSPQGSVRFTYNGYAISVSSDGEIVVSET